jgi:hypothetical protein
MNIPEGCEFVTLPPQPAWAVGVWAVVSLDMGWTVNSVHRTAEAAVAAAEDYHSIRFLPFDTDVQDVCSSGRKAP